MSDSSLSPEMASLMAALKPIMDHPDDHCRLFSSCNPQTAESLSNSLLVLAGTLQSHMQVTHRAVITTTETEAPKTTMHATMQTIHGALGRLARFVSAPILTPTDTSETQRVKIIASICTLVSGASAASLIPIYLLRPSCEPVRGQVVTLAAMALTAGGTYGLLAWYTHKDPRTFYAPSLLLSCIWLSIHTWLQRRVIIAGVILSLNTCQVDIPLQFVVHDISGCGCSVKDSCQLDVFNDGPVYCQFALSISC